MRENLLPLSLAVAVLGGCGRPQSASVSGAPEVDGARVLGEVEHVPVYVLRDPVTGAYVYAMVGERCRALAVLPAVAADETTSVVASKRTTDKGDH